LSQLGSDLPAVTAASGLFPRLSSLRDWVGGKKLSCEGTHLSCRGGECIDLRALLGRQFRGRRIEHGQQADNPEPSQQGNSELRQVGNHGETLLLWFVTIACFRLVAELIQLSRGIDQGYACHLLGITGGVR
jgi:hypothetical protein